MKLLIKFVAVLALISGAVVAGVIIYDKFFSKKESDDIDECECF